jgi:hypothetical protein
LDYMTRENLVTAGRPFVEAFTDTLLDHIDAPLIPEGGSEQP